MTLQTLAWLALAAYAAHVVEEFLLDWRTWARAAIGLPVDWPAFHVVNAAVMILGIAQAMLAPALPLAPLSFAALMAINALFFHVMPVIRMRGRFSPGLISAVALFLPLSAAIAARAAADGTLGPGTAAAALAIGAALMAWPIVLMRLAALPRFDQRR